MAESLPDLFAQCPRCRCFGHHPFTIGVFHVATIPGPSGEPIKLPEFGDPPEGTPVIKRSCEHCGHCWNRAL